MRVGVSTYSLLPAIRSGEMTILDVIDWITDNGGEHMEIVPYGFTLEDNEELTDAVRKRAEAAGIQLSNYSMPANFVHESKEAFDAEVERIKRHVDTVHRLGIKHMRHDVTAFTLPPEKTGIDYVEDNLEQIVNGCRQIADYAARYGITTTIENHGVSVQASDRVQRVLKAVDRPNFKTTLDIGNFLCVDEQPLVGVKRNLPYASLIHVKDFYYRPYDQDPGGGRWFRTSHGNYLRGAIFGQGDLDVRRILRLIKESGYDGFITLEFEGMEDCREGTRLGLENLKRLWDEIEPHA
ncbi:MULTISPECIES: sugar phosphate isomerase/epimerase family protein [Paenibacillus]|uniref:sugar phosphate isomerase/epimerase family protein n=1 Tax=Paenibacillus TaxID=44249 RepID=UPI00203F119A|nr:sugar phosphate isomerase/epimerase family protein [Paenibacillus lactis]MCM3492262.1 sugar phosphate isomerase/epimerase [Paenibacillus lactis]